MKLRHEKTVQVLHYLISGSGGRLPIKKLLYLVWFSDRLHMRRHGRLINEGEYRFNINDEHVIPIPMYLFELFQQVKGIRFPIDGFEIDKKNIISTQPTDISVFSQSELDCMYSVLSTFKKWRQSDFSEIVMFPEQNPWRKFDIYLFFEEVTQFPDSIPAKFFNNGSIAGREIYHRPVESKLIAV